MSLLFMNPRQSRLPPRFIRGAALMLPTVIVMGAAHPTHADAAAPSCPTARSESTAVTWGAPGSDVPVRDSDRGSEMQLSGLAANGVRTPPTIRTRRDSSGRGRAVLCTRSKVRFAFPTLPRGRSIEAASVNGSYVVWRQSAPGPRATVVRARVVNARLRDVRRLTVRVPVAESKADHRIVAHANGTVAWALQAKTATVTTRVWIWPKTGRVRTLIAPDDFGADLLRVVDDQQVLGDDTSTPVRYAPAIPGRCPKLTDTSPSDLAGWQTARISGTASGDGTDSGGISWNVVCDPSVGRYVAVIANTSTGFKGDSVSTSTIRIVRSGRWLLFDKYTSTEVIDTQSGRHVLALGGLTIPGQERSLAPEVADLPLAAFARPGGVAFVTSDRSTSPGTDTLNLADASGLRAVATTPASTYGKVGFTNLAVDETSARWTASGQNETTPFVPVANAPFGVVTPEP